MNVGIKERGDRGDRKYPVLMEFMSDPEFIVLFTDESTGVVISGGSNCGYDIGTTRDDWSDERFKFCNKVVELSN